MNLICEGEILLYNSINMNGNKKRLFRAVQNKSTN